MASVKINSGEITATLLARDVPVDSWPELVEKRYRFSQFTLTHDCRSVVQFIQEADDLWQPLGYESANDLIRKGYGLEPEEIRLVAEWLALNDPESAIGLEDARTQAIAAAKAENPGISQSEIAEKIQPNPNTGKPYSTRHIRRLINDEDLSKSASRVNARQLYLPQDVERAAQKIRDKFGEEFAQQLKNAL